MQNLITIFTLLCLLNSCSKKSKPIVLIEGEPQEISEIRGYFHEMEKDKYGIPVKVKESISHLNNVKTKGEYLIVSSHVKHMVKSLNVKNLEDYDKLKLDFSKKDACKKIKASKSKKKFWTGLIKEKAKLKNNNDYWKLYKLSLFLDSKFYLESKVYYGSLINAWEDNCDK